jgi:hypothetical protein
MPTLPSYDFSGTETTVSVLLEKQVDLVFIIQKKGGDCYLLKDLAW